MSLRAAICKPRPSAGSTKPKSHARLVRFVPALTRMLLGQQNNGIALACENDAKGNGFVLAPF